MELSTDRAPGPEPDRRRPEQPRLHHRAVPAGRLVQRHPRLGLPQGPRGARDRPGPGGPHRGRAGRRADGRAGQHRQLQPAQRPPRPVRPQPRPGPPDRAALAAASAPSPRATARSRNDRWPMAGRSRIRRPASAGWGAGIRIGLALSPGDRPSSDRPDRSGRRDGGLAVVDPREADLPGLEPAAGEDVAAQGRCPEPRSSLAAAELLVFRAEEVAEPPAEAVGGEELR